MLIEHTTLARLVELASSITQSTTQGRWDEHIASMLTLGEQLPDKIYDPDAGEARERDLGHYCRWLLDCAVGLREASTEPQREAELGRMRAVLSEARARL